jgi:hypothetical protein
MPSLLVKVLKSSIVTQIELTTMRYVPAILKRESRERSFIQLVISDGYRMTSR